MSSQGKAKEIVENFYASLYNDPDTLDKYLHPDVELTWHSSTGDRTMNFSQILDITKEVTGSYESVYIKIHSIINQENQVAVNLTYHVKPIENPDEEVALAHFMAFWQVKEEKMFRGHQISQLADEVYEI